MGTRIFLLFMYKLGREGKGGWDAGLWDGDGGKRGC